MKKVYVSPLYELEEVQTEDIIAISNAGSTIDGDQAALGTILK